MKVQRAEGFQPVTITLESQEEVNAFYAILNCGPIADWLYDQGFRGPDPDGKWLYRHINNFCKGGAGITSSLYEYLKGRFTR